MRSPAAIVLAVVVLSLGLRPAFAQDHSGNMIKFGWATGGYAESVVVEGDLAYVAARKALNVYDVSDPATPRLIHSEDLYRQFGGNEPTALDLALDPASGTLYVAAGADGLWIHSLDEFGIPQLVSRQNVGNATECSIDDGYLIVLADGMVRISPLSNPLNPTGVFTEPSFTAYGCDLSGGFAFVMGIRQDWDLFYPQLKVLDRATMTQLTFEEYPWQGSDGDVIVDGSTVYTSTGTGSVYVSTFTAPATLTPITSISSFAGELAKSGSTLYTGRFRTFEAYDVSDPANPSPIAGLDLPTWLGDFRVRGDLAYLPTGKGGLQIVDLRGGTGLEPIGHCWYPSTPYGMEYRKGALLVADEQLLSLEWGLQMEPMNVLDVNQGSSGWKNGMSVDDDGIVYIVDAGLAAVDASDPTQLSPLGSIQLTGQEFDAAHWNDTVFAALVSTGFGIADFSDPTNPQLLYEFTDYSVRSLAVWGDYLYVAASDGGSVIQVFDVSDPTSPVKVWSELNPAGSEELLVAGGHLFVVGSSGAAIYSLIAPASPALTATIPTDGWMRAVKAAGHRLYLGEDDYFRVYDISDRSNPVEIAYYQLPDDVESIALMEWSVAVGVRDSGVHVFYEFDRTSTPLSATGSVIVAARPNPIPGQGSIALRLGFDDDVRLELYDVAGRRIRDWRRSVSAETQTLIPWDGMDHSGRPVASGVYFYRLRTSRGEASGRVTVLR